MNNSVAATFTALARDSKYTERSLDVLAFAHNHDNPLPSWVPDLEDERHCFDHE